MMSEILSQTGSVGKLDNGISSSIAEAGPKAADPVAAASIEKRILRLSSLSARVISLDTDIFILVAPLHLAPPWTERGMIVLAGGLNARNVGSNNPSESHLTISRFLVISGIGMRLRKLQECFKQCPITVEEIVA